MKASKKKNNKVQPEIPISTDIKKYFHSTPKESTVVEDKYPETDVYVKALKAKLQDAQYDSGHASKENNEKLNDITVCPGELLSNHTDVMTIQPSQELIKNPTVCGCIESKEWEKKYKELKKTYLNLTHRYSELDQKFKDLYKMSTLRINPPDDEGVSNEVLSSNEIKSLRAISLEDNKDSTFILQCLDYAYNDRLSVLTSKSVTGKMDSRRVGKNDEINQVPGKDPLTPKKVSIIKKLFIERISQCDISAAEYSERIKDARINQLLGSSIKNITKRKDFTPK